MSVKITMHLEGARSVRDSFRALPPNIMRHVAQAVRATTAAVERGAKMRAPVSAGGRTSRKAKRRPGPGELRDTIRSTVWEGPDAVAGFVSAGHGKLRRRIKGAKSKRKSSRKRAAKVLAARKAAGAQRDLGVYAMVVEYGSPRKGIAAQPYMRPALEAEKGRHAQRMQVALNRAVEDSTRGRGRPA